MSKNTFRLKALIAVSCLSSLTYADISGIVYTDFNLDGIQNNNDTLLSGVAIHAICEDGSNYNTTTNKNGFYILENTPSGKYCRVEADPSSRGLDSSSNDGGSAPLVDRVADSTTNHNISVASSGTYCQENPKVLAITIPTYIVGGSTDYSPETHPTLIKTIQPSVGTNNGQNTIDTNREIITSYIYTGATWGLAYKRDTNDTFMAASLKPYADLGVGGVGAIYKVTSDGTVNTFTTIPNVSSSALDNYLNDREVDDEDSGIYTYIAREGLGDIEISEDHQTLYVLNMYEKSIVEVNASNGLIIKTTVLPNPYNTACPAADVRPWALTVKGKDVYVGSVCESKISNTDGGLGASIQKYNGAIVQEIARTNTLDYLKPYFKNPTKEAKGKFNHKSWGEEKTSPILTDIEIANNGDLILAYTNRSSFIRHSVQDRLKVLGGDIRKMCQNNDGTYTDENTAEAPTSCNSHQIQYSNNTDTYYEFYLGDFLGTSYGENGHPETMAGALVQEPGKPYITASVIDGTAYEGPGAIAQLSHISGRKIAVQALLKSQDNDEAEAAVFGRKAGGLGDIELMCDPAPIEIGNYIWLDLNEDGIQDPEETPLSNIKVKLYDGTTLIGETDTDTTGHYYFGGLTDANLKTNKHLTSYHAYTIKVNRNQNSITEATVKDTNNNADDIRDSDARTQGDYLLIDVTTNVNNNHSLDIGIVPVKIGNRVWIEDDNDGDATTGNVTPVVGTTVTATCNNVVYTAITDSAGKYKISVPANVNCQCVKVSTPSGTVPTHGSNDNSVTDTTSEENKTHNGTCTSVSVGTVDNMTLDFGFHKSPKYFDLALIQKVNTSSTPGPYKVGEDVTFKITVCNQGTLDASNIQINNYIPSELRLNDSNWYTYGDSARLKNPISSLNKGSCKKVDITFTIKSNAACQRVVNNAEICSANGGTDIDSTPCSENGTTPDPKDNDMTDTTGGDDYDPADIRVSCNPTPAPTPTSTPQPVVSPAAPVNLEVIVSSEDTVTLLWGDNSSNESGFKIYQNGKLIAIVPADTTTYILKNLKARETYTYAVKSFNASKESKASNSIKFTAKDDYAWLISAVYYPLL